MKSVLKKAVFTFSIILALFSFTLDNRLQAQFIIAQNTSSNSIINAYGVVRAGQGFNTGGYSGHIGEIRTEVAVVGLTGDFQIVVYQSNFIASGACVGASDITTISATGVASFNFSTPLPVSASTDYVFAIREVSSTANNTAFSSSSANPYPNGVLNSATSGTDCPASGYSTASGSDLWFKVIAAPAEINVLGNAITIADGDVSPSTADDTDFGSVNTGASASHTFTIENTGYSTLNLTGLPLVSLSGSSDFAITTQPASTIAPGSSTSFTVQFSPSCPAGSKSATISILSDDADESPYTFDIAGTAVDTIKPMLSCPADLTFGNIPGSCDSTVFYPTPGATDNCGVSGLSQSSGLPSGSSFPVGTTINTYVATDIHGNSDSCSFNVIILDNEKPVITGCPPNIIVNADSSDCNPAVFWTAPMATDNCSLASWTATFNPGASFPIGVTPVDYTATDSVGNSIACTFTVTVNKDTLGLSLFSPVDVCGNHVSCNGGNDGQITAMERGGCAPYTYSWNTGDTTKTVTGLSAGTYYVDVADINGFVVSDTITLMEPSPIVVAVTGTDLACNGDSSGEITAAATGGCGSFTYAWTGLGGYSAGGTFVDSLAAGWYGLTVTDTRGCVSADSVLLAEPAPIVCSSVVTDENCGMGNGAINLTPTGGTGSFSFSWSNSASTEDITGLGAGWYYITATDSNGCQKTDSMEVLSIPAIQADLGPDTNACSQLVLNANPGMAAYNWSTGSPASSILVDSTGTYSVITTDTNGCITSDTVNVLITASPILLDLGGDRVICPGDTTCIDAGAGFKSYAWMNGDTTQVSCASSAGWKSVTVTDFAGCIGEDSIYVAVNYINPNIITNQQPVMVCVNGVVTLNAQSGFDSYTWFNGDTTTSTVVSSAGTYWVTVTDTFGCSMTDSVPVTASSNPAPKPQISPQGPVTLCGNSIVLDAGLGYFSYSWNTGATTQQITVNTTGQYIVMVQNGFGCEGYDTVVVNAFNPVNPFIQQNGDTLCVTSSYANYQWYYNGQPLPAATGQCYIASVNGNYYCHVTDSNGCSANSNPISFVVATGNHDISAAFGIYPNPAKDVLNIRAEEALAGAVDVKLINLQGQVVKSLKLAGLSGEVAVSLQDIPAGLYLIRIRSDKGDFVKKVVIQ